MKKGRSEIPPETAARVLFESDRICCVCREPGRPVQIHHIDGDPCNNKMRNLAVLCLDCHRETQIRGGFDRKLDSEQIILYRDDWHRIVAIKRAALPEIGDLEAPSQCRVETDTSLAEIYRENEEYELLAMHYDGIGNVELRDKYVEIALKKRPTDANVCLLRGMQGKPELIPEDVVNRQLSRLEKTKSWSERARFHVTLRRYLDAAKDYIESIGESLKRDSVFAAAFALKEMAKHNLIEELFIEALRRAREEGSLWWQVRALEELGRRKELDALLLDKADEIQHSDNFLLLIPLAKARGDVAQAVATMKEIARGSHMVIPEDEDVPDK